MRTIGDVIVGVVSKGLLTIPMQPAIYNQNRTAIIGACIGLVSAAKLRELCHFQCEMTVRDLRRNLQLLLGPLPELFTDDDVFPGLYDQLVDALASSDLSQLNTSDLYEYIISHDWGCDDGVAQNTKTRRKQSGSYFTSESLADGSVQLVFAQLMEKLQDGPNDIKKKTAEELASHKIIDPSCGTGRFLKAVLRFYSDEILSHAGLNVKEQRVLLKTLALNLHGIDVDHIALVIAALDIAMFLGEPGLFQVLRRNFVHGNPLLTSRRQVTPEARRTLSGQGYIYHEDLGILQDLSERYDIVIGNPPWEKIRLEERSFFLPFNENIVRSTNKHSRSSMINELADTAPALHEYYVSFKTQMDRAKVEIQTNPKFAHSAFGELNTYSIFTELTLSLMKPGGVACLVVKSAIATSPVNRHLFKHIVDSQLLISFYDFINRKKLFAIDSRERFAILLLGHNPSRFSFVMGLQNIDDLHNSKMFSGDRELLSLVNPVTGMLPNVESQKELRLLVDIYEDNIPFSELYPQCKFGRLAHLTGHAAFISRYPSETNMPVYEGKFLEQYGARFSTFDGIPVDRRYSAKASARLSRDDEKMDPDYTPTVRYYIDREKWTDITRNYVAPYSLVWRSLTSASNKHVCIATVLPHMPTIQSIQLLQVDDNRTLARLVALFNSSIFNYILRLKLNGIDLTGTTIKQMPVPPAERYLKVVCFEGVQATIDDHICKRVSSLLGDDRRLEVFCRTIFPGSPAARTLEAREVAMAEINELVLMAYDVTPNRLPPCLVKP